MRYAVACGALLPAVPVIIPGIIALVLWVAVISIFNVYVRTVYYTSLYVWTAASEEAKQVESVPAKSDDAPAEELAAKAGDAHDEIPNESESATLHDFSPEPAGHETYDEKTNPSGH